MHQISFGSVLKEARLAQGRDLASVSRELRIRQDIIVSIENSDFKRMPSRGYARNMIIAYSRLLGLNAQDVSRMYLDQEYAYQVEQAHQNVGDSIRMHRDPHGRNKGGYDTSSFEKVGGRSNRRNRSSVSQPAEKDLYDGSSNGFGRAVYSQNADVYPSHHNPQVAHRARRSAMPTGKYGNMYAAPQNIPNPNRNRNILIGIIVAVVVVVALVVAMMLSHQNAPQTNIPVTGAQTTQSAQDDASSDQQQASTAAADETAPTEFTLKYSVAKGSESYIEVYVDDKAQESATVSGPAEKSYTSSSKIRFVSTETKGVTVTINDEAVDLKANSSGIVNQTFTFSDILDQWYADHPNVKRDTSSTSSSSSKSTDSSSSSSTSTSSSSKSSSSSSSDSSKSSSSSSKSSSSD